MNDVKEKIFGCRGFEHITYNYKNMKSKRKKDY